MPLVGTWIEIIKISKWYIIHPVVPLVGTWIEICSAEIKILPAVVPLVGTWIEIDISGTYSGSGSRAPRGHVD